MAPAPVAMASEIVLVMVQHTLCAWEGWGVEECFPSMCEAHVQAPGILSLRKRAHGLREKERPRGKSGVALQPVAPIIRSSVRPG